METLMNRSSLLPRLVAIAALATTASSQSVFTVSTNAAFLNAIGFASSGDVIIAQSPAGLTVPPFRLTRGVTIVGPITISPATGTSATTEINIPAGETARFIDVVFERRIPVPTCPSATERVLAIGGSFSFEDCTFSIPISVSNAAAARFDGCALSNLSATLGAREPTLSATNCHLELVGSEVNGRSEGSCFGYPSTSRSWDAEAALVVRNSTVLASHSTIVGGQAGLGNGGIGVISSASDVWLSDCRVQGGGTQSTFGTSASATQGPVRHARSLLVGGGTGAGIGSGAVAMPGLIGISTTGVFETGSSFVVDSTAAQAGIAMALLLTNGIAPAPVTAPVLAQPLWASAPIESIAAGVTTGPGTWTRTISIPQDPALRARTFQFLAAGIVGSQVQLSPMVGGVVRW